MPIALRCSKCSKTLKVPDSASGKQVKCPGCQTLLTVPKAKSGQPSSRANATGPASGARSVKRPQPAASTADPPPQNPTKAPGFSPFAFEKKVDDSLLTDSDFVADNPIVRRGPSGPEIPQSDSPKKRSAAFYKTPATFGIVAVSLNSLLAVGLSVLGIILIVGVTRESPPDMNSRVTIMIVVLSIFACFTLAGSAHAILACRKLMQRSSRKAATYAVGELLLNPLAFAGLFYFFDFSVTAMIAIGVVTALWNVPAGIWIAFVLSGKQAKIDFDEVDQDDLDALAAELQRRASLKEGGH